MSSDGKDAPREAEDGGESLASATRALTEALGQLSRAVKREAGRRTQETAKKGREVARGAFGEAEWAEIVGISNSVLHLPRIYTQEV